MCRWIAYSGPPVFINEVVSLPEHSLVEQSINSKLNFGADGSLMSMNGDGFGLGWYHELEMPGLFKDERPAWGDINFHNLCEQIKSPLFLSHVRAATTGATQRSNCHPFKYKNWLFQHNGSISNFEVLRQDLQSDIDPDIFLGLQGTTDSETFFLLAMTYGLNHDPKAALQKAVKRVQISARDNKTDGALNLSCTLSDGEKLYTMRYAEKAESKTQFFAYGLTWLETKAGLQKDGITVVSEPLEHNSEFWAELPDNSFSCVRDNEIFVEKFM